MRPSPEDEPSTPRWETLPREFPALRDHFRHGALLRIHNALEFSEAPLARRRERMEEVVRALGGRAVFAPISDECLLVFGAQAPPGTAPPGAIGAPPLDPVAAAAGILRAFLDDRGDHAVIDGSLSVFPLSTPLGWLDLRRALHILGDQVREPSGMAVQAVFFSPEELDQAIRMLDQRGLTGLRRGFDEGEVDYEFQPIVHAESGAVIGYEALVRWRTRSGEVLTPDEFGGSMQRLLAIPSFASLRRIVTSRVPDFVRTLAGPYLAINVDPARLDHEGAGRAFLDFHPGTEEILPHLVIELTERGLGSRGEMGALRREMEALRTAGARFALDDFGSDGSQILRLLELPFDFVKLDRSLTRSLVRTAHRSEEVRRFLDYLRSLGVGLVAEGVEDEETRDLLIGYGVVHQQGYLHGHPRPAPR